eukprot:670124_1
MSNAIKMKKENKKQNTTKISQSIPAHFYKNYHPPKTPKIIPVDSSTKAIPDFEQLPKISPTGKGINIKKTGGHSLRDNQHPMSMPARHGLMGPSTSSPFNVDKKPSQSVIKEEDNAIKEEQKAEPNSLEQRTKQLKVGSFTCFDVMNSPLKQLSEAAGQKDDASATSAQTSSTFASGNFEDDVEVAPEDDEDDDEEGGGFEMEL